MDYLRVGHCATVFLLPDRIQTFLSCREKKAEITMKNQLTPNLNEYKQPFMTMSNTFSL